MLRNTKKKSKKLPKQETMFDHKISKQHTEFELTF